LKPLVGRLMLVRLLPILSITAAASFWFNDVQEGGPFVLRNLVPLGALTLLAAITLWRGDGKWAGSGWRLPLGVLGFTIPAFGLSLYLHYAYSVNLNGMFTDAIDPGQLFRYLPIYTMVAGGIGFAIGWIVGNNV
jgi:hypothetical protein